MNTIQQKKFSLIWSLSVSYTHQGKVVMVSQVFEPNT